MRLCIASAAPRAIGGRLVRSRCCSGPGAHKCPTAARGLLRRKETTGLQRDAATCSADRLTAHGMHRVAAIRQLERSPLLAAINTSTPCAPLDVQLGHSANLLPQRAAPLRACAAFSLD